MALVVKATLGSQIPMLGLHIHDKILISPGKILTTIVWHLAAKNPCIVETMDLGMDRLHYGQNF